LPSEISQECSFLTTFRGTQNNTSSARIPARLVLIP
jgi:hypothetical protein